jgi:hypothetical protein
MWWRCRVAKAEMTNRREGDNIRMKEAKLVWNIWRIALMQADDGTTWLVIRLQDGSKWANVKRFLREDLLQRIEEFLSILLWMEVLDDLL